jgi:hypothetical protein
MSDLDDLAATSPLAVAELERLRRLTTWQPIETAPATPTDSDDSPQTVLLWVADGGHGSNVAFGRVHISRNGKRMPRAYGYGGNHEWQITHWMPLPAPPGKPGLDNAG